MRRFSQRIATPWTGTCWIAFTLAGGEDLSSAKKTLVTSEQRVGLYRKLLAGSVLIAEGVEPVEPRCGLGVGIDGCLGDFVRPQPVSAGHCRSRTARAGGIEERSEPYSSGSNCFRPCCTCRTLTGTSASSGSATSPEDDPVVALRSVVGGTVQFRLDSMASCSMNDPSGVALARRTWLSIWQRAL